MPKLSFEKAEEMRDMHQRGASTKQVAEKYGVCVSSAWNIICRRSWKSENSVGGGIPKLSLSKADEIRERYRNGERQLKIAKECDVHPTTINKIISGKTYTNREYHERCADTPWFYKITKEQRDEIVKEYATGNIGLRPLGRKYGLSHEAIRLIVVKASRGS